MKSRTETCWCESFRLRVIDAGYPMREAASPAGSVHDALDATAGQLAQANALVG